MTFPTIVNGVQAPAVAGDFADKNPRFTVDAGAGALVAGALGVTVGLFCWADAAGLTVSNSGTGPVTGFIARSQQAIFPNFQPSNPQFPESGNLIPSGLPVTVFSGGSFWVKNSGASAVSIGQKAYANYVTGAVTFGASGSPPQAASVTGSIAVNSAATSSIALNSFTGALSVVNGVPTLTVSAIATGALFPGQTISNAGGTIVPGTTIVSQLTGTTGSTGTYQVSVAQAVNSGTITGSGGTLTVAGTLTGTFAIGQTLTGSGVTAGTTITNLISGTGGLGTYAVSIAQTVASTAITASGGTLTVTAVGSGALALGQVISGSGVTAGTYITGNASTNTGLTGAGGTGTYLVSVSQTATSTAITSAAGVETKFVAMSTGAAGELVKMSSHLLG